MVIDGRENTAPPVHIFPTTYSDWREQKIRSRVSAALTLTLNQLQPFPENRLLMCIFDISREELGQLRLLADLDSTIIRRNILPQAKTRLNPECGGHAGGTLERRIERARREPLSRGDY